MFRLRLCEPLSYKTGAFSQRECGSLSAGWESVIPLCRNCQKYAPYRNWLFNLVTDTSSGTYFQKQYFSAKLKFYFYLLE